MNIALKIEQDGVELLEAYLKCKRIIEKVGWLSFFLK
jgi:hypothetical protein